jgi:hypothetical protein
MKCLTAQRVKSRAGEVGINRYRYSIPDSLRDAPEVWSALERDPGVLEAFEYAVKPPGNNAVISYLDIIAPDAMTPEQLTASLGRLDGYIAMSALPIRKRIDDAIQVQFGAILALEGEPARREFHELARAALRLVPRTTAMQEPLILQASIEPDGVVYRLDEDSRQRLGVPATSVRMSSDNQDDLGGFGNVLPQIALLLSRLTADELAAAGGARIIDASSRQVLATWPIANAA